METLKYDNTEIKMYVSADELTIDRWTLFNKYLMLDGIIGNSFEDIEETHLRTIMEVIDDRIKLVQAIRNLRELVYAVTQEINYSHFAFCTFIHSINGNPVTDLTDTGVREILALLAKIGVKHGDIKKKIIIRGNLLTIN